MGTEIGYECRAASRVLAKLVVHNDNFIDLLFDNRNQEPLLLRLICRCDLLSGVVRPLSFYVLNRKIDL